MGGKMQVYSKAKQIELKRMWFNKFKESEKRVKELETENKKLKESLKISQYNLIGKD